MPPFMKIDSTKVATYVTDSNGVAATNLSLNLESDSALVFYAAGSSDHCALLKNVALPTDLTDAEHLC